MQTGFSINPMIDTENRFSGEFKNYDGKTPYKSTSTWNVGDIKYSGTGLNFGYDILRDFGHLSLGYYTRSSKNEWTTNVTFSNSCTADYRYVFDYEFSELLLAISFNLGKTTLMGGIDQITQKQERSRNDELTNGCTWTATGSKYRSYSGNADGNYIVYGIVGKTELTDKLLLGYTVIPESTNKSNFSDDYSNSEYRIGSGTRYAVSLGSENELRAFEGGVYIENESQDAGSGKSLRIFGLFEKRTIEFVYLASLARGNSEKLVVDDDYLSRPFEFNEVDLQIQFLIDDDFYLLAALDISRVSYGDFGVSTEDDVKPLDTSRNNILFGLNAEF